jgi:hypothetical protein
MIMRWMKEVLTVLVGAAVVALMLRGLDTLVWSVVRR